MTDDIADARAKMIAKRFGGSTASTSTGGKGSVRRKKKVSTARSGAAAQSDAKLNTTLKKLGATNIPGIEEVNFFKEDGKVVHFRNPKVQASVAANTYIISGPSDTKPLQDLLPSIASQLGMDSMAQLQRGMGGGGMPGMPGMMGGMPGVPEGAAGGEDEDDEDDDDDVPDLVDGTFEQAAET